MQKYKFFYFILLFALNFLYSCKDYFNWELNSTAGQSINLTVKQPQYISIDTAIISLNFNNINNLGIIGYGVYFSSNENFAPNLTDSIIYRVRDTLFLDSLSLINFSLKNLIPNTKYYVKAIAYYPNDQPFYSPTVSFTTKPLPQINLLIPAIIAIEDTLIQFNFNIINTGNIIIDSLGVEFDTLDLTQRTTFLGDTFLAKDTLLVNNTNFIFTVKNFLPKSTYFIRNYFIINHQKYYSNQISRIKTLPRSVANLYRTMVDINGDVFVMGCTNEQNFDNNCQVGFEEKSQTVDLSDFKIARYEVSQELWQDVLNTNPSIFKGPNLPVENISWHEAQNFIATLNTLTGRTYKLPTEAQWEFAARSGGKNESLYSGSNNLDSVSWYNLNSQTSTHNIGSKGGNKLGIFDMTGNVAEWCFDWFGNYTEGFLYNPSGPTNSPVSFKVYRGGSWQDNNIASRLSYRFSINIETKRSNIGFRVAIY